MSARSTARGTVGYITTTPIAIVGMFYARKAARSSFFSRTRDKRDHVVFTILSCVSDPDGGGK